MFMLPAGDVTLNAREAWPKDKKVYCHPASGWPDGAEILEEVPMASLRTALHG